MILIVDVMKSHQYTDIKSLFLRQIARDLQNTVQSRQYQAVLLSCFSASPLWREKKQHMRAFLKSESL